MHMLDETARGVKRQGRWIAWRGVTAVLFGVFALAWPGLTLAALVLTWGAYSVADGALALVAAWQVRSDRRAFWSLLGVGLLGVAAGVGTWLWPAITQLALLMVIASWAIATGAFQIVAAIRLRNVVEGGAALGLSGALSVVFGALMFASPGAGALAMVWAVAGYSIAFGGMLIALGVRLRAHATGKLATA
jgi:uncharacterized membrane protein HdeD (DUF308 family)